MKRLNLIVLVLVLHILSLEAIAQKHHGSMETLRGVDSFNILIENMPEEFMKLGLPQRVLLTGIEQRLKGAGITVRSEVSDSDNASQLYVNLSGFAGDNGSIVYSAMVRVNQMVIPAHNRAIMIQGGVWFLSKIGVVPVEGAVRSLQDRVGDLVDEFISDYKAFNPN